MMLLHFVEGDGLKREWNEIGQGLVENTIPFDIQNISFGNSNQNFWSNEMCPKGLGRHAELCVPAVWEDDQNCTVW